MIRLSHFFSYPAFFLLAGLLVAFSNSDEDKDKVRDDEKTPKLKYTYGAKYEPPEGRVIHGMGQWNDGNQEYLEIFPDQELYPLFRLFFFGIEPTRPWPLTLKGLKNYLVEEKRAGRVPFLNLGMQDPKADQFAQRKQDRAVFTGVDARLATTDQFDQRIMTMADLCKEYGTPMFLRIGPEFSGSWNDYHPYYFPKAFRKIVEIFEKSGVKNVAYVWCYEPAAEDDFDARSAKGENKWFPGEDVVDWFGIDLFARRDFSSQFAASSKRGLNARGRTERFLEMARRYKKPVVIAESSVVDINIKSKRVWDEWFAPYFSFIQAHGEIKAFVYVNGNWPKYRPGDPFKWGDGRINLNPEASRRYIQELQKDKYLHCDEGHLLNKCGLEDMQSKMKVRKSRFLKSK